MERIEGKCAVYDGGEQLVIDGAKIDLERTDRICVHALAPLLHYVVALRDGVSPTALGLACEGDTAYVACVDPGPPYTNGGRVIFKMERIE